MKTMHRRRGENVMVWDGRDLMRPARGVVIGSLFGGLFWLAILGVSCHA